LSVDFAIRIGLLALLGYWSLKVIGPFLTVALWSAILAVALYPLFDWFENWALNTLLGLMIVIGPVTWLGLGLIGGIELVIKGFDSDIFSMRSEHCYAGF
jgi:predicted PurR-regulated permease PerM